MNRIICLAQKDMAVLIGDKANVFWVFGFPIVFALFFGLVFSSANSGGGPKNMQIGLVDQDQSKLSQRFAEHLDAEEALELTPMPLEQARDQVRKGKLAAALIIKENFSERNGMGFGSDDPIIQIMADPARQMQTAYLQGMASKAQFQGFSDIFTDPNRAKEQFQTWRDNIKQDPDITPLLATAFSTFFDALEYVTGQLREHNEGTDMSDGFMSIDTISIERQEEKGKHPTQGFQITFPQCILWGILGCAATFAVSIVKEQTTGTFARLCVGPVKKSHILAGKGLACFVTCVMVMICLYILAKLLFHVPINNVAYFIMASICAILCFVGIMMFACTLGKTEQSVGASGWALMMVMAMLGGGMMPLVFMPKWMQTLGTISPVKWGIYALEGAIWRHFSFTEMLVPCGVLLAIGAVFFAIGATILGRQNN
jgi:ABC-2 type transport system permease protein